MTLFGARYRVHGLFMSASSTPSKAVCLTLCNQRGEAVVFAVGIWDGLFIGDLLFLVIGIVDCRGLGHGECLETRWSTNRYNASVGIAKWTLQV
jgi:hypothetical protein